MVRECLSCGLFQSLPPVPPRGSAECARCATVLHRARAEPLARSLPLTLAALALMAILCATTLMTVETAGITLRADLFSGPEELARRGMPELAVIVLLTTVAIPVARMLATLYVLLRLRAGPPPAHLRRVFVWVERLTPWAMIDVFVFGVFVAYVKLGDLVTLHLGVGVYALLALTIVLVWSEAALGRQDVWTALSPDLTPARADDAGARRWIGCETCGLVQPAGQPRCRRCASRLHPRKPDSIARTWALLLAAAVLYVPANLYPVLTVMQFGAGAPSTILGGVAELLASGMYPLAALVFFASVAVPLLKMLGLAAMLLATQTGRAEWLRDRTRLYQFVRWIGRWSMIDIFMEALLGALVRFGSVVTIEPGYGAVAFCAVVLLTMAAAECFDPRLMWDAALDRPAAAGATSRPA